MTMQMSVKTSAPCFNIPDQRTVQPLDVGCLVKVCINGVEVPAPIERLESDGTQTIIHVLDLEFLVTGESRYKGSASLRWMPRWERLACYRSMIITYITAYGWPAQAPTVWSYLPDSVVFGLGESIRKPIDG